MPDRLRRRLRAAPETWATRLFLRLVPGLPRRAVLRLARALGTAAYHLARGTRRVGEANLDLALGDAVPPAEKRRLLREAFRDFALVALDAFWFGREPARRLAEWVRFDASMDAIATDRPQILLTGHLGNWEVLGQAITARLRPLMSVAAPLANPAVDRMFVELRRRSGQEIVASEGALLKLARRLRAGGKVALLLDQNTKPRDGGAFVAFFGLPVPVSQAAAALALRTRADIGFCCCLPQPDGIYRAYVLDWIRADPSGADHSPEAVRRLTQEMTALAERAVRAHPEHWLWMYKRWKHVPPGHPGTGYPFYAKRNAAPG